MSFPKKSAQPIATTSRSSHDLSCQHVTSSDFMQFQVSKCMELVPKQSISLKHECFSRLAPMPVPTFGRGNVVHRAFFVPMRTIFPCWDDFITDNPHYFSTSNTTQIPAKILTMANNAMLQAFITSEFSTIVSSSSVNNASNPAAYDFSLYLTDLTAAPESTPTPTYYKLTPLGRFAYKLLCSLGMTLNWEADDDEQITLLPLFAALRVFYDYYYPSQYMNDEDSSYIVALLTRDVDPSTFTMDITGLQRIFRILYNIPYTDDYFVNAWDSPTSPSSQHYSSVSIPDITTPTNDRVNTLNGTPTIDGGSVNTSPKAISQYALNSLRALSDYMKRHQIAGSRALDRFFLRFGIKLAPESLKRSKMIVEYKQDMQFGDVFSTASTSDAVLGEYAGKGLSYGDGSFDYQNGDNTADYGFLLIISTIVPKVQYYQGYNRHCKHVTRLDFWTPEFDNLGTQAIARKEVYCNTDDTTLTSAPAGEQVFGFGPRYAEYKIPYSQITGDLFLPSFKTSSQPWTLFRDMKPLVNDLTSSTIEHGINFVMATDRDQYNRIFNDMSNNADHFFVIHNFEIKSNFPGKSLYDDYEFQDEDKAEKVNVDVNGTQLS